MRNKRKVILLVSLLMIAVFMEHSQPAHGTPYVDPNYRPNPRSVQLWINEALTLGDEIPNATSGEARTKTERFNTVLKILIAIGYNYPDYIPYYRDLLIHDADTKKKVLIASILSALGDSELSNILLGLLDDDDVSSRVAALLYYQDIKDSRIAPKLKSLAHDDPDIRVRIMAARALRTIDPDALKQ